MSYKINKYSDKKDFIVEFNHNQGLQILDGAELVDGVYTEFTYALLPNEMMFSEDVEIEVTDYDEEGKEIGTHTETVTLNYPIINPNYEEEQKQKERQRIAMLSLTRGDVFRGLLLARNVTRQQLRTMIETNPQLTDMQREMALIDFDEALNFYRGNTLIDTVGLALGIEPAQLDCFFETNDYTCLYPKVEPEEPEEPVEEETDEQNIDS